MKLSKLFVSSLATYISLYSSEVAPSTQNISAFVNPSKILSIKANINYLDKGIDIFGSIDSDKTNSFGHVGKLLGTDINLRYGFSKHISFLYNFSINRFDFIDSNLNNLNNELIARVNFYDVPNYIFDDFTIDFGLVRNSGNNVKIKDANTISKTINLKELSSMNNSLLYNGIDISNQIDPLTNKSTKPYLSLSNMSDNSFFIRAIWGNRFASSILNIFTSVKYTDISTNLKINPNKSQNIEYNKLLNKFKYKNIGRDEKTLGAGINFVKESENFIYDINYRYLQIFSRDINSDNNHNNIFSLNISYKANSSLLLFAGGDIMLNGYNGVIPYLFNQYSKDSFKRYGYIKLGLVYNFEIDDRFLYKNY